MGVFRVFVGILLVLGLSGCGDDSTGGATDPSRAGETGPPAAPVFVQTAAGLTALDGDTGVSRWSVELDWPQLFDHDAVGNAIVTVADGTLFAVAVDGLRALDARTGAERWRQRVPPTSGLHQAHPVLVVAGGVVLVSVADILHAFDRGTGDLRWRVDDVTLLAVDDGTAFAHVDEVGREAVTAIDTDTGEPRWRAELDALLPDGFPTGVDVAVASAEALVVLPGNTSTALALDPATGAVRWTVVPEDADGIPLTDIAGAHVVGDRVVFTGTLGDDVEIAAHRLADGTREWTLTGTDFPAEQVLVGPEGVVGVVGPSGGDLDARDLTTGRSRWTAQSTGAYRLAAIDDGVVYAHSQQDGELTAFRMSGGEELWTADAPGTPVVRDGRVHAVRGGGVLGENPLTVTSLDATTGESRWTADLGLRAGFIDLVVE